MGYGLFGGHRIGSSVGQPPQQPQKHGGGTRRAIGILGDVLLGLAGQPGVYGPMVAHQRFLDQQNQQRQQERQQERQWGNEDWMQRRQWQLDHPAPVNNDTINDVNWYMRASPEERAAYDAMHPVYRTGPDGLPYPMARGQLAPPTAPVGRLTPIDGGAAPAGAPPFVASGSRFTPPQRLTHGSMTSGRRTVEGNRLVGGVPNSGHLRGTDVDYDGPDLNALLAEVQQLPGYRKGFIHGNHVHASGDWDVPYFGRRGTTGLRGR